MGAVDEKFTAFHFLGEDKRLRYGDNRLVEVGNTYSQSYPHDTRDGDCYDSPTLCESGMHASIRPIDALKYAPGPIICRVEVSGDVIRGDDKLVGRHRKVLAMADATRTLHEFAVAQARSALELTGEKDERCFAALEAKILWLDGKITDDDLARARAAAWGTARDAAWDAAWAAAWDAAWDAAWAAARAAAWDAAWAAAWDAAWAAARAAANEDLEARLKRLLEGSA